jgi:hypothetical protein
MIAGPEWLLIGAVAAVGVLHTVVPDHWVPITLIARQQGWTRGEVARAALVAGTGHTVSTLLIGLVVWIAGVAFATRFGNLVSTVSSLALIAFGAWISGLHSRRCASCGRVATVIRTGTDIAMGAMLAWRAFTAPNWRGSRPITICSNCRSLKPAGRPIFGCRAIRAIGCGCRPSASAVRSSALSS